MEHASKYVAKQPDANGYIEFTDDENSVWRDLYHRQMKIIEERACDEFIEGIKLLNMQSERIPQIPELCAALHTATGWGVEPVPALIDTEKFFTLLANRKFPAATFIRRREDLDYLQEPDLFHEYFGHCPLLALPAYADFVQQYGEMVLRCEPAVQRLLLRLFWFTIEFGLIKTDQGLRIYGGGILSSKDETIYCLESDTPKRYSFEPLEVLRTPYRIDIMQPIYFILAGWDQLYHYTADELIEFAKEAVKLGDYPPSFPNKNDSTYDDRSC